MLALGCPVKAVHRVPAEVIHASAADPSRLGLRKVKHLASASPDESELKLGEV